MSVNDLSGVGRPLAKAVDAIRATVGALYEPKRIRRRAMAEADSTIIAAEAQAAKTAILDRADRRLEEERIRHQMNLEAIVSYAVEMAENRTVTSSIDPDWVFYFLEEGKNVSD